MPEETLRSAIAKLTGATRSQLEDGVRDISRLMPALPDAEFRQAVEALCSLFYVDTYDHPELEPLLDLAAKCLARQGVKVVPLLLEFMEGSDVKSHIHLGQAIGMVGAAAIPALRRFIATADDPYSRAFALFAIGKVRAPEVAEALPEVIGSLMHPDKEVRDSAARAVGKIVEVVPPEQLGDRRRTEIYDALFRALDDKHAAVRAKAVRSLGKLALAGYLAGEQEEKLKTALRRMLGEGDAYDWDRAYIVRREAEEALWRSNAPRG